MSSVKPTRVVFQLPNIGSWFENIAVTADGTILASRVDAPEVWAVDPATGKGEVWVTFPAPLTAATGIAELKDGLFALGAGRYDIAKNEPVAGSMELWTAQFTPGSSAKPKKVLSLPDIGLLNGVERWDDKRVLVADSNPGRIYLIDVVTATATVPITDDLAALPENPFIPIAANGVRVSPDRKYVYFSNSAKLLLGRVPVDADAKPTGPGEVVMQGMPGDDFAFSKDGKSVYLTTHTSNTVVQIDISGKVDGSAKPVTVAGAKDKLEIPGTTAVAWGRRKEDADTLYVVTAGGLSGPVNGQVEPAKVAAVDFA